MQEEPKRLLIKISDCDDSVPWLQIRVRPIDTPAVEKEKRLALARSMLRPTLTNNTYNFNPTGTAYAFAKEPLSAVKAPDLSIGQIHPIRVFRYPPGVDMSAKPYGVICGHRRIKAARELNAVCRQQGTPPPLEQLEAVVYTLTKEEYDSKSCRFIFRAMAVAENCHRQDMHTTDRVNILYELAEAYYDLYPAARKHGPRSEKSPHSCAAKVLSKLTGVSEITVRSAINMKKRLATKLFAKAHRGTLPLNSLRQLLPIPKNSQERIVERIERAGKPVTETTIRDEIARWEDARHRHLPAIHALPASTAKDGPSTIATLPAVRKGASPATLSVPAGETSATPRTVYTVACKNCPHCLYITAQPEECPVFGQMLVAIDVAAVACMDLSTEMTHSPQTIAALKERVAKLATAATTLHRNLISNALPIMSPRALPPRNGRAA